MAYSDRRRALTRAAIAILIGAALLGDASSARADEPTADQARGWETPPSTTPEDVALFVPRVVLTAPRLALVMVFFPLQAGLRFVSRQLGGSEASSEEMPTRRASLLPHLSFLSHFGTTVGAAARYQNIGGYGEEAAMKVAAGGVYEEAAEVSFRADRTAGSRLWLESVSRYEIRPREVFDGIGDGAPTRSRFLERHLMLRGGSGFTTGGPGRLARVGSTVILEHFAFATKDDDSGEPSIERVYDTRKVVGFDRGVSTLEAQANLVVDTRDHLGATSRGVRADVFVGGVPGLGGPSGGYAHAHAGADMTGVIDLYHATRVLLVRGAIEGVAGADADIPFVQLPRLGGPDRLRGYRLDRYRDRTSALASLEYRYPIHDAVAGALFVDAGHVAADVASLTAVSRWRAGVGGGVRVRTKEETLFVIDVAYGDGVQLFLTAFPFDRSRAEAP